MSTLTIEIPSRLQNIPPEALKKSLASFLRDYTFPNFRPLEHSEITPELQKKAEAALKIPKHLLHQN